MNGKILLITYPFPPIPYSGTYRIIRICKGLSRLGVEVHALSININDYIPNDYDLLKKLPIDINIHRTYIPDPWLIYQIWNKNIKDRKGFKHINKIFSFLIRLLTIPDHQIFWIPFAFKRALKIIKKHKIKNVVISSPPVSSLLTGCLLKKFADINFIADLRDPIIGNIAQVNLINPKGCFDKLEKRVLKYIERTVIKYADAVVTNTKTHNKEMKEKFKTGRFITIRNAFDEDDYKGIQFEKYDKFTVSHLGGMYGLRKADILFKAIKKLEKEILPDELNLQMLFVGACDKSFQQAVTDYEVEKYVRIVPNVPHQKALEIMGNSHLLLVVKATGKGSLGQIPAKFFEYLGTKNMIICLGPEESEVASLIKEINAGITVEKNVEVLTDFLVSSYKKFLKNEQLTIENKNIDDFNSDRMTKKFKELIYAYT